MHCAQAVCLAESPDEGGTTPPPSSGNGGPNSGAIAGGVIGGVIVIAALTYLVWRFLIKPKRSQIPSIYEESARDRDSEKDAQSRMTKRSSTHTVHSIASTVLTRASNIIQIAYIPGVTNRAGPSSGGAVPPVPPIPMQHTDGLRSDMGQEEQHFFVPGDLRNSTYSGYSNFSDRTSYARTSYAPRSSIASTIYGRQAQVQQPAQAGMRVKPTMVSVKSGNTPPVPSIDFDKFGNPSPLPNGRPKSGQSTFSVGSTFLNNANTAQQARAQVVKVGGGLKTVEIGSKGNSPASTPGVSSPKEDPMANTPIIIEQGLGPFSDPPANSSSKSINNSSNLAAVTEDEEERRDSERSLNRPGSKERGSSPFGDEHAT